MFIYLQYGICNDDTLKDASIEILLPLPAYTDCDSVQIYCKLVLAYHFIYVLFLKFNSIHVNSQLTFILKLIFGFCLFGFANQRIYNLQMGRYICVSFCYLFPKNRFELINSFGFQIYLLNSGIIPQEVLIVMQFRCLMNTTSMPLRAQFTYSNLTLARRFCLFLPNSCLSGKWDVIRQKFNGEKT